MDIIQELKSDKQVHLALMLLIALAFTVYFAFFLVNEYSTFKLYVDMGTFSYNLFFNLHYPQIAYGLQYLVVVTHISPYLALFYPLFAINSSSLMILFFQLLTITATGIAVFFVTRDLTKDSLLALIFGIVFFIYPGTLGITIYGAHIEFPLPLFYILTFYFYAKREKLWFAISAILFAATAEVTPILILCLAAGLLLFEFRYKGILTSVTKASARRSASGSIEKRLIIALLAIGVTSLLLYSLASSALVKGYGSGAYSSLPQIFYITKGAQAGILPALVGLFENPLQAITSAYNTYAHGFVTYFVYGFALVILGYGITMLFVPDVALVFALPWLAGVFLLPNNPSFVLPYNEYFSLVIGPVVCASILGALVLKERGLHGRASKAASPYGRITRKVYIAAIVLPLLLSVAAPALYLFVISPYSAIHTLNLGNLNELLLFQTNASQRTAYSQLNFVIDKVPANASLITDSYVMPHVTDREYLDIPEALNGTLPFIPEFILVDPNASISTDRCLIENCTEIQSLLGNNKYFVYAQNGTAILYERN